MKMKKILCSLLSASIIAASVAVPVLADEEFELSNYTAGSYDSVLVNEDYNTDGTVTNTIDNTKAKAFTDQARVYTLTDTLVMNKETFITFDFCIATADAENAYMQIRGSEVGPQFSFNGTQLRNQKGNGANDYENLGEISTDTWYTAELEGKTNAPGASVKFRLYKYESGTKTLIKETVISMRRYWSASARSDAPYYMEAKNISIDNVKVIQEYPDEIRLSSAVDEVDAGASALFDYKMYRNDTEVTKYGVSDNNALYGLGTVTWSLEGNDSTVTIDQTGKVSTTLNTPSQTVTVKLSSTFAGKELTGTKTLKINGVDLGAEKFTEITINGGADTVKAGESLTFTATTNASATLSDGDIVWKVYNYNNVSENANKAFTLTNGTLSIADGTLPQDIYVRAMSESGKVFDSKKVTIEWSDNQKETPYLGNACEAAIDGADTVNSFDGSKAYSFNSAYSFGFGDKGNYILVEMDAKFSADGGFVFKRADGTENSSFYFKDGGISQQTGSSKFSPIASGIAADKWYHIEITYLADADEKAGDGSFRISEYNDDGTLTVKATALDINRRNRKNVGTIQFQPGIVLDNLKVTEAVANEVELTAAHSSMFPTEDNQMTATLARNGLPIKSDSGVEWLVLDATNKQIIDGSVTIDATGLLKASAMAPEGFVTVQAKTATASATVSIEIKSSEIFTMKNIGINEAGDKVVKLYAEKLLAYDDDVVFVMAFYDENKSLLGVRTVKGYGSNYVVGDNEITVDWDIPSGFDKTTDQAKVYIWTAF